MKINLLPKKKAVWKMTYKSFHIVALIALIFNMSSVGVFFTPNTALAAEKTPETAVVAEETVAKPTVEATADKTICTVGEKCEDTGTILIKKFLDLDEDGIRDANETLLSNWHFTITNGAYSTEGATNSEGVLFLYDMAVGTYQVTETLQAGWTNTTPLTQSAVVTKDNTATLHFGNIEVQEETGNLRIKKYNDLNSDGVKQTNEPYMTGWHFDVTQNGQFIADGNTGEDGDWLVIENLPVGTYQVTETQKDGWRNTDPGTDPITKNVNVTKNTIAYPTNVWFGNVEIPGECKLEITKSVNKTEANPGDTLEYTLSYKNVGTADCTGGGVQLFDNLDDRLTYNGIHSQDNTDHDITFEGNFNGTSPVANAHVVSPEESGYVKFQAVVTEDLECGENIIPNKYRIWSNETGDIWSNEVNTTIYKECYGSLKVIKYVDFGEAEPDMWEFTVQGQGTQSPVDGENYVIFTGLPEGLYSAIESTIPGYHQVSSNCNNVQVNPGEQAVCEFHNTKDTFCKMNFTKSVDKENALPGDVVTYTLNYENTGDADCTGGGVKIYDDLDNQLTYVDDTLTGNEYNGNGDGISLFEEFDGVNPLANAHEVIPGESGVITFQATITDDLECGETVIPNKAKMWSNETGYFWSNQVETTVFNECYGSLKVIKYVDEGDATPDMWDFTIAEHGTQSPADGENYVVFTQMPEGFYTASESTIPGYHQVSSTCDNVEVIAGQQAVCEFHNTVDHYDINGYKWNDLNDNGEWDQNEPGKSGWTINLNTVEGTPLNSTITSDDEEDLGHYEFTNLLPGIYQVCEAQNEGWYQTYPSENNGCHYIYLGPNADNDAMSYNFGNTAYGEISGAKFDDANGNHVRDTGEPGLENWTIQLTSSCSEVFADYDLVSDSVINLSDVSLFAQKYDLGNTLVDLNNDAVVNNYDLNCFKNVVGETPQTMTENPVITKTTDESGYYQFTGLQAGAYNVSEVQQDGWTQTFPESNGGVYGPIVITSGKVSTDNDFGNLRNPVKTPDISLVKEITNHNLVPGGFVEYKLTYANTGEVDLTNVYIVDNYPEQYLSISNTGGATDNGSELKWIIGDLAVGGTGSVTYTATIKDTTPANVDIINIATIYSDQTGPKEDDAKTVIPPVEEKKPILTITKDVNVAFANPEDTVKYTVVVSNVGDATAVNVVMTDVLPKGLTYPEGGTTKTFSLGDIEPGKSVTTTYDAVVGKDTVKGNYVNTATAKADNHDEVSDDATLEVRIPDVKGETTPELEITKEVNVEFANPGDVISYTIIVKNVGDGEAINVILTDRLPEGLVYDGTDDVVKVWNLGNMAPNATKTITYAVKVTSNITAGIYENVATVGADNAADKSAKADVEVRLISVLGAELPDTGTSAVDYLYYLIGIVTLIIGLWTIQRKNSGRSIGKQISAIQTLARKR
ncbi:MAG: SdrD B-like domain-containing protein [Patescibacteria group bacterium]